MQFAFSNIESKVYRFCTIAFHFCNFSNGTPCTYTYFFLQIEDAIMQQQVESYKHALRDWDEQQQRHRAAIQQARASQLTGSSSTDEQAHTATTA